MYSGLVVGEKKDQKKEKKMTSRGTRSAKEKRVSKVTCVGRMRYGTAESRDLSPSWAGNPHGSFDLAGDGGNVGTATGTERGTSIMHC